MGAVGSSILDPNKDLYDQITEKITEIMERSQFWTNQDLCDRLELVYSDQLQRFDTTDLAGASVTIGIRIDDSHDKKKICTKIIDYYTQRIGLMREIWLAVKKSYELVNKASNGPVCRKVKSAINNFIQCTEGGTDGEWLTKDEYEQLVRGFHRGPVGDKYDTKIEELRTNFNHHVSKLLKVVNKIDKDMNNSLSDEVMHDLTEYARHRITKLEQTTELLYLVAINY